MFIPGIPLTGYVVQTMIIKSRFFQRYYEWRTLSRRVQTKYKKKKKKKKNAKIQKPLITHGFPSMIQLPFWTGPLANIQRTERKLIEEHTITFARSPVNTQFMNNYSMFEKNPGLTLHHPAMPEKDHVGIVNINDISFGVRFV